MKYFSFFGFLLTCVLFTSCDSGINQEVEPIKYEKTINATGLDGGNNNDEEKINKEN
ncbi:hypothetical protein [Flammeovirga pacifica]|uniref:hypothetical protein n=1 Tax=Flammeovirga pacifica TaxID=915059 RepID=UPI001300EB0A|nr:hypothetical protein [Flammeovirga pacifica]